MLHKHYRGGIYSVLHRDVIHENTKELMVVYTCVKEGRVYARPQAQFDEYVIHEGQKVKRFTPIG